MFEESIIPAVGIRMCDGLSLWYGFLNTTQTAVGTTVKVTCAEGYMLIGQSVVRCQGDGTWSDVPTCEFQSKKN